MTNHNALEVMPRLGKPYDASHIGLELIIIIIARIMMMLLLFMLLPSRTTPSFSTFWFH